MMLQSPEYCLFGTILEHFKKKNDNRIVKQMKPVMLTKLDNRYSPEQTRFFRMCTLLDVRYKNSKDLYGDRRVYNEAYTDLENNVKHIVEENNKNKDNSSPEVIPVTQGQELENLSNICQQSESKRQKFEIHCHKGDDVALFVEEPIGEPGIADEIKIYQSVKISKGVEKDKLNLLKWWKDNGSIYPCLYLAVKCTLSIPATSVPAERIFSLAGFLVTKRRAQLKADKVNNFFYFYF